jgi:hypothetical protein
LIAVDNDGGHIGTVRVHYRPAGKEAKSGRHELSGADLFSSMPDLYQIASGRSGKDKFSGKINRRNGMNPNLAITVGALSNINL